MDGLDSGEASYVATNKELLQNLRQSDGDLKM